MKNALNPSFNRERAYFGRFPKAHIAGVDEVGKGAIAGPVLAVAVSADKAILGYQNVLQELGVDDSKRLSKKQRQEILAALYALPIEFGFGMVSPEVIDEMGITRATDLSHQRAIDHLSRSIDQVYIDGLGSTVSNVTYVVKGDQRLWLISLASIIAKTLRDAMMQDLHAYYPQYEFMRHVGYGTLAHYDAIAKHGICQGIHRVSFIHQ